MKMVIILELCGIFWSFLRTDWYRQDLPNDLAKCLILSTRGKKSQFNAKSLPLITISKCSVMPDSFSITDRRHVI